MTHNPGSAIPLGSVLGAMRSALNHFRGQDQIRFGELMAGTMRELARLGHTFEASDGFDAAWQRLGERNELTFTLIEGYWQLLTLGYIVPWPNTPNAPHLHVFRISLKGKRWAQSEGPVPEDSERFIAALSTLIPTVDSVIKQYFIEAVITYNRQAWFASAVMVGAASEKVVYMLADALLVKTGGTDRRLLEKAIKERSLPSMIEQLNKVLKGHIESNALPYEIHEGCEPHMMSLFEAIRVQRNDAVHPTVGEVTPDTVHLSLSAFPSACRKVYDLIGWCQTH